MFAVEEHKYRIQWNLKLKPPPLRRQRPRRQELREPLLQICSPQPSSPRETVDLRWSRGRRASWAERGDGIGRALAKFLSSPPPFGEASAWRSLPARFRFCSFVIGYTLLL
nr:hypothetical protein Iba_chr05fCG4460 [Ipomoea batatas]